MTKVAERCRCGAETLIEAQNSHAAERMLRDWRMNHWCTARTVEAIGKPIPTLIPTLSR